MMWQHDDRMQEAGSFCEMCVGFGVRNGDTRSEADGRFNQRLYARVMATIFGGIER